jgi:hypothetical protein
MSIFGEFPENLADTAEAKIRRRRVLRHGVSGFHALPSSEGQGFSGTELT